LIKRRSLAHLSDLHIGAGRKTRERAAALSQLLLATEVDHVVVTGDITHRGRRDELEQFRSIFAPWISSGRLTAVPGNHDCLGDGIDAEIMCGARVVVKELPGLYLVLFNSTGPHNRSLVRGHGMLTPADMEDISRAVAQAPKNTLVVLLLHHHVLPLPGENVIEKLFTKVGWPFADELYTGRALLDAIGGRCDLILHGHRHQPVTVSLFQDSARPLSVCNAGSSTALGGVRVFTHHAGEVLGMPGWLFVGSMAQPERELTPEPEAAPVLVAEMR
jgi:3',5'-cyclic AMP phosphodiesterase CpdA